MAGPKDKFRGAIAPGTYVGQVGLLCEYFRRAEVTEHKSFVLDEEVVRLDVSVTDAQRVDVHQSAKRLVGQ